MLGIVPNSGSQSRTLGTPGGPPGPFQGVKTMFTATLNVISFFHSHSLMSTPRSFPETTWCLMAYGMCARDVCVLKISQF